MTKPIEPSSPPPPSAPGRFIAALALSIAVVPLNSTMIAVAIPSISADIAVPAPELAQWLVTSYLLVNIVLQSPTGKLGDTFGHARALELGRLLFAAGSVVGFLSKALPLLVTARVLMATGGAIIAPAAMALLRNSLAEDRRARAFGAFGAVMGTAAAIGPLLGGEIVSHLGWSWLFLVNAPPLVLSALLARGSITTAPQAPPAATTATRLRFDIVGSALLGGGLALVVLATKLPGRAALLGAASAATLALFIAWERVASDPVVDLTLFKRRIFTAGTLVVTLQNLAMYALLFSLPITFSRAFHATSGQTGRAMLAMTGAMVVCSPLGGRVAEKLGARGAALLGTGLSLAGMLLLAVSPLRAPNDVIPGLVLLGGGLGFTTPSAQSSSMSDAPPEKSGMAAGIGSTARYLGGVVGVAIMSTLADRGDAVAMHHLSAGIFSAVLALSAAGAALLSPAPVAPRRGRPG